MEFVASVRSSPRTPLIIGLRKTSLLVLHRPDSADEGDASVLVVFGKRSTTTTKMIVVIQHDLLKAFVNMMLLPKKKSCQQFFN